MSNEPVRADEFNGAMKVLKERDDAIREGIVRLEKGIDAQNINIGKLFDLHRTHLESHEAKAYQEGKIAQRIEDSSNRIAVLEDDKKNNIQHKRNISTGLIFTGITAITSIIIAFISLLTRK